MKGDVRVEGSSVTRELMINRTGTCLSSTIVNRGLFGNRKAIKLADLPITSRCCIKFKIMPSN